MILYCLLTALINAIASLVLGIAVFVKRPRDRKNVLFTRLTASVIVWSTAYFLWQLSHDAAHALLYCRILTAGAIVIAIHYFHFTAELVGKKVKRELMVGYILAGLMVALSPTSLLARGVSPKMMFPFWPEPGILYPFYLALFLYFTARPVMILNGELKTATGRWRNQLRYVLVGTSVGVMGGSTNFFLWYNVPIPPIGNGLVALYIIGVGYAVIRYRLMEVDFIIVRLVSYFGVVALLCIPVLILVSFSQAVVGYGVFSASAMLVASFVITALLFVAIPFTKRRVDRFLEGTVMREKFRGRDRLRNLAREVAAIGDEQEIFREAVNSVSEALDVQRVALLCRAELDTSIQVKASVGYLLTEAEGLELTEDHVLVRMLLRFRKAIVLEELEPVIGPEDWAALHDFSVNSRIEVAVPVFGDTSFYGLLALGPRKKTRIFSDLDLSLLEAICLQIGLNLRSRQLERRANQTEKLISLGTLAAGLAHELRNPLVSIQTFTALLGENPHDEEFQREFRNVMERDVGRIVGIVENISAFATNNTVSFSPVRIEEVITGAQEINRTQFADTNVDFVFAAGNTPLVHGNYNQLLQVFINLFQNAAQAMAGHGGGRISITVQLRNQDVLHPFLEIAVSDNGPGIPKDLVNRVFEPFMTTKSIGDRSRKGGMGLGLAIVKRIIDCHHGAIQVSSEEGHGTTFSISLPCLPVGHDSIG